MECLHVIDDKNTSEVAQFVIKQCMRGRASAVPTDQSSKVRFYILYISLFRCIIITV